MRKPEVRTERLVLRRPRPEDAPGIAKAAADIEVSRWLTSVPHPYGLAEAEDFIARCQGNEFTSTRLVCDETGVVGCIGVEREFGYWFGRLAWGRGYGTEAGRAVLAEYFCNPGAVPLEASHFEGNARSARVLAKMGFGYRPDPPHRVTPKATGETVLCHRMLLTPEQWHALNPWVIKTERLMLRPMHASDVADVARIGGDGRVAPMIFAATVPWPEAAAARFIEVNRWRGRLGFRLGITRGDKFIGTVGLFPTMRDAPPAMAYFLDPDHWGQGYATEALRGVLPAAMARFGLKAIGADVFHDNPGSARVLEKLGFIKTGTGMGRSAARLEPAPVTLYRVTKDQLKA